MRSAATHRTWSLFRSPGAMRDALVLLLAFTAGCVDAISYLDLGHIFTANMTGNTVLLGLSLAQAQWPAAVRSTVALAAYLTGVAGGKLVLDRFANRRSAPGSWPPGVTATCMLELFLLTCLTIASVRVPAPAVDTGADVLIILAAAAMGLQGIAVHALSIRGVATTYITGTWTAMMAGLVSDLPLADHTEAAPPSGTRLQAAVVGIYLGAAVVGGLTAMRWHLLAFAVPTVAVAVVSVIAWRHFGGAMSGTGTQGG